MCGEVTHTGQVRTNVSQSGTASGVCGATLTLAVVGLQPWTGSFRVALLLHTRAAVVPGCVLRGGANDGRVHLE